MIGRDTTEPKTRGSASVYDFFAPASIVEGLAARIVEANRNTQRLNIAVTHRKQTTAPPFNRNSDAVFLASACGSLRSPISHFQPLASGFLTATFANSEFCLTPGESSTLRFPNRNKNSTLLHFEDNGLAPLCSRYALPGRIHTSDLKVRPPKEETALQALPAKANPPLGGRSFSSDMNSRLDVGAFCAGRAPKSPVRGAWEIKSSAQVIAVRLFPDSALVTDHRPLTTDHRIFPTRHIPLVEFPATGTKPSTSHFLLVTHCPFRFASHSPRASKAKRDPCLPGRRASSSKSGADSE